MHVIVAASWPDALGQKHAHRDARALAGGTDLLAQWQAGVPRPQTVIALEGLRELQQIAADHEGIRIGAGVTHATLAGDATIARTWPALAEAAATVGAPAIRAMGTLGGNLANASPAADLPPALLAHDAQVIAASVRGERRVPLDRFFIAYRSVDLAADELIAGVWLPMPRPGNYARYLKVGTRAAQSIAKLGLAAALVVDADGLVCDARFAAASLAPTPVRLRAIESAVVSRRVDEAIADAIAAALRSVAPIDDVRSTAAYRRRVLGGLVGQVLSGAARVR